VPVIARFHGVANFRYLVGRKRRILFERGGNRLNLRPVLHNETVMTVLDPKLADHSRHQEMIRTVQWALIRKKQVTGQYLTPYQAKPVRLTLYP
jgi:hypothetical protein